MLITNKSIKSKKIDLPLLFAIIGLCAIGTTIIISAVSGMRGGSDIMRTHFLALPTGIMAFLFGWLFNYQIYAEHYKKLYAFIIIALVAVLGFGIVARGSNSWFRLGIISIQPAEICRIALIVITSAFLSIRARKIQKLKTLFLVGCFVVPVFVLIMLQPDFSSIVITAPALLILLFASGVDIFYFILLISFCVSAGIFPLLWTYYGLYPEILETSHFAMYVRALSHSYWAVLIFCSGVFVILSAFWYLLKQINIRIPYVVFAILGLSIVLGFFSGFFVNKHIKNYQRKRVEAFLAPEIDPKGASYNVLQAQIAMGSGGVIGKGFFSGTQSRLGFVPERHTDFILAVLGEETGLIGTLLVLFLYLLVLWRIVLIAMQASDLFGYFLCVGIFGIFFVYMVFNFGMLIGILPVAGVPLPFISYGGSNLVASLWAMGLVESVYSRRLSLI